MIGVDYRELRCVFEYFFNVIGRELREIEATEAIDV